MSSSFLLFFDGTYYRALAGAEIWDNLREHTSLLIKRFLGRLVLLKENDAILNICSWFLITPNFKRELQAVFYNFKLFHGYTIPPVELTAITMHRFLGVCRRGEVSAW